MKPILKMNKPDFGVGFLKSRRSVLDSGILYPGHSTEPSQASRTFTRRAPEAVKHMRRIIVSWVAGPPFKPKIHSAIPIYPRFPAARIGSRMIRRPNLLSPELCLFNDIH